MRSSRLVPIALAVTALMTGMPASGAGTGGAVPVVGAGGAVAPKTAAVVLDQAIAAAPEPAAIRRLEALMESVSPAPLYKDNSVTLLIDGPRTYEAMLGAIAGARDHVHLETYILNDDTVGRRFARALMQRRAAGVNVRVIYDSLGSRTSPEAFFDRLRRAGIELLEVNPVNPLEGGNPADANVRDHRKLLVVDGRVAFTGGINLDKNYASSSSAIRRLRRRPSPEGGWRDTHIEIRGPAVAGFQDLFLRHWQVEKGARLPGPLSRYYPPPVKAGPHLVRVLSSIGGNDPVSPIRVAYGLATENASDRIWITQSYFAPDEEFLDAMMAAARRGVDVRILVTGITDAPLLLYISRSWYEPLLESGVRIFESTDMMVHAKTAVVDGVWSTVGSSNLDYRSFIHNHEVNAVIVGRGFGSSLEDLFQRDVARSQEIRLAEWRERPWWERVKERASRLFEYWL